MQPRLLIISGSLTGTVQPLINGYIAIAFDESNQLCLIDSDVSRKHCAIEQLDDQFVIVDRDSPCGTFVNGIPVSRKRLEHGDAIRIGRSELVFLLHEGGDT
jgi:pSer/pThr/pTyr-binding forkhead associated (FHA) protein